jgi:hypothetical protein
MPRSKLCLVSVRGEGFSVGAPLPDRREIRVTGPGRVQYRLFCKHVRALGEDYRQQFPRRIAGD